MRLPLIVIATLLLAGCGSTPPPVAVSTRTPIVEPDQNGSLIGLDTAALLTRFGQPRLRVREGEGTKLQFSGPACLLDAYLYPSGGVPRVAHVDTRDRDGRSVAQAGCIASIGVR